MQDVDKTKEQLINELMELRKRNADLEKSEAEYKQIEEALRESEEKYRMLVDNADEAIVVAQDGVIRFANPRMLKLTGYLEDELKALSFMEFIHPDDCEMVFERYSRMVKEEGPPGFIIFRIICKDGSIIWMEPNSTLITWEGRPATLNFLTDITERKIAEEALRESEERFRSLMEQTTDAIFCYEYDPPIPTKLPMEEQIELLYGGTLVECNEICAKAYGASKPEEVIGKKLTELFGTRLGSLDRLFAEMIAGNYRVVDGIGTEILPDGSERYFLNNGTGIVRDGNLIRVWGTYRDITDRRQAEERLKVLSLVVEQSGNSIGIVDGKGNVEYMNPQSLQLYGISLEDVVGKPWLSFTSTNSSLRERRQEIYDTVIIKGMTWTGEITDRAKNGEVVWRQATIFPIKNDDGETTHSVYMSDDITDRKRMEVALRENESRYRDIIAQAGGIAYQSDWINETYIFMDDCIEALTGYKSDEITPELFESLVEEHITYTFKDKIIDSELYNRMGGDQTMMCQMDHRLETPDGRTVWLADSAVQFRNSNDELIGEIGMLQDITERKQAEEQLRNSEERLRILFEYAPDAYYLSDLKGTFVDGNKAAEELTGYQRDELIGQNFLKLNLLSRRQIPKVAALLARNVLGQATGPTELILNRKDGSKITVETRGYPVKVQDQTLILGIARDVTERKKTEEAYRSVVENSIQGLMIFQDFRIVFANPAVEEISGYTVEELTSMSPEDVNRKMVHPEDQALSWKRMQDRIDGESVPSRYEYRGICKSGEIRWIEAFTSDIEYHGKPAVQSAIMDITERKKAQAELQESKERLEETLAELRTTQQQVIQQERLGALGQLASGIAHDFNNAIMPIMGYSELLINVPGILEDREKTRGYLELMNTAAEDAREVVSRLREFYRPREEDELFASVDLNETIEEVIQLTQPKWKGQAQADSITINIETDLQESLMVNGNKAQLREVLTNLVINSVDAMPVSGTISLNTRGGDEYVVLEVIDTGTGMTEETRKRCFEPFFSTKGERGTGLGLSMVHGIIRRHGGAIQIRSEIGKGTTFTIHLPQAKQHREMIAQDVEAYHRPLHILVVDDEISVRDIVTAYLTVDGHTYEIATNGREALEKFRAGNFDLMITDRAMPDIGGTQLAALIKQIAPKMPVIMLTGFGDMMMSLGEMPEGVDQIVSKPVTLQKFREALTQIADSSSESG